MPIDTELTLILENLINSLRYSGWTASLVTPTSKEDEYILAQKDETKIVIKVFKNATQDSLDALKTYARDISATPYIKKTYNSPLEKISI
jgi:hypothetical protein